MIDFKKREGMVLITSLLIAVLILMGSIYLFITLTEKGMSSEDYQRKQAFWLAEAGLERVTYQLESNSTYRSSPTSIVGVLGGGNYSVTVNKDDDIYTLTSTGNKAGVSKILKQTVTFGSAWDGAFNYALFGNSGTLTTEQHVTVTGDIFQRGNVNIDHHCTVTGYVDATGTITASHNTSYGERELESYPAMPALNTTHYNGEIATAAGAASGDQAYTGGTLYVNGNATINNGTSVTGPGTLVATGNVEVQQNVVIGSDITIISGGTLGVMQNSQMGENCSLYASTAINFAQNGVIINNSSLLSPGNINIIQNLQFNGIIYSGGSVTLAQNAVINGSVVSNGSTTIPHGCSLIYDETKFPSSVPPGLEGGGGGSGGTISNWQDW